MTHPARARRRVRAARVFISPKAAGPPDLLVIWGGNNLTRFRVGKMLPNQEVHERWVRGEGKESNS
jgi:hypothetical protein